MSGHLDDAIATLAREHSGKVTRPPAGHLSVKDLAERAGVSKDTVKRWIHEGMFPNASQAGDGPTHPWFIPESDIVAAANPSVVDPLSWPVELGCNGLSCTACGSVLLQKRKDAHLATSITAVRAAVTDHLTTCKRAQET